MIDWVEIPESQGGSTDRRGENSKFRTFKIHADKPGLIDPITVTVNPSVIINSFGQPLPAHGSQHPGNPALILDRWEADFESHGSSVIIARALYSTNGRFNFPQRVDKSIGDYDFQDGHALGTFEWRFARSVPKEIPGPGGTPQTIRVWEVTTQKFSMPIGTVVATAYVNSWPASNGELVNNQIGKIHFFRGRWHKFVGGVADQESPTRWRVDYTWEMDPGHVVNPFANLSPHIWFEYQPATLPPDPTVYVRRPFHTFVEVWTSDDIQDKPGFIDVAEYLGVEPNGHFTLPGIT